MNRTPIAPAMMAMACDMPVAPSSQAYSLAMVGTVSPPVPTDAMSASTGRQHRVPPDDPDIPKALDHVHQEAIDQIENGGHAFPTKMMR